MHQFKLIGLGLIGLTLLGCQPGVRRVPSSQLCFNQPLINQPVSIQATALAAQGVLTVMRGDERILILPTDLLFKPHSDRLNRERLSTLNEIAPLLKASSGPIFITGHTDNIGAYEDKQQLSRRQAQRIAAYFWGIGLHYQRFVTRGAGDLEPITEPSIDGSASNRRIEIRYKHRS